MVRDAFAVAVICGIAAGCGRQSQPPPATSAGDNINAKEPPMAETENVRTSPARRFTGTLRGGIVAIGAETTGWVLERDGGGRVDVDVSKVADAAAELEGKPVVIEGDMVSANWVERGARQLLMADSISAVEDAK